MEKKDFNDLNLLVLGIEGSVKDWLFNVFSFFSVICSKCKCCILVMCFNNYMGLCIGNSG